MTNAAKRRAIIFLFLTGLITVLLAVAMPQLELQKGVPLPKEKIEYSTLTPEAVEPPPLVSQRSFIRIILALFFLMVIIYLIVVRRKQRRWSDWVKILTVLVTLFLIVVSFTYAFSSMPVQNVPPAIEILPPAVEVGGPPLAPVPGFMLWVVWAVLAGMVLLLVLSMTLVRIKKRTAARDPLVMEVEEAVEALKAGQDFSNVIIRCYQQMSLILKKEQNISLEKTMTAREFEALLEKRGVPNPPVRQLTRLFEIARYAAQGTGPEEETQAVECLNAIAQYSKKKGPGLPA